MSDRPRQACGGSSGRRTGGRLRLPALAAGLAALVGLSAAEPDERPASRPAPPTAERVLGELRAANAARSQLLEAEQDWALEKEKLQLLEAAVLREAQRLRSAAAAARREAAELKKRTAGARAKQQRLEEAEAMADTLAERLEKALAALGGRCLPGLVPPDRAAGITDPGERLSAAADRLGQAERQARKSGVEVVTGSLGGEAATVKLLRAGAVAAWWMSLDGERCGQAAVKDGKLSLTPARTTGDTEAIRKAFAIAEGHAAPAWSLLPVHHVRLRRKAGEPP